MCRLPLFAALVATLALTLMASVTGIGCALAFAVHGRPGAILAVPMQLAQGADRDGAALDRAYFVGAWETQNREFGRDVQVIWTVRSDGSLKYDFVIDGAPSRGSTGTWDFNDGMLIENWDRADGSTGSGRASIEKIDDQTFRLTVIDNGAPEYRGLVRTYRRLDSPQTRVFGTKLTNTRRQLRPLLRAKRTSVSPRHHVRF
jgi:hypothetical protein